MTGNVVLLGFAIAGASGFSVAATAVALGGFVAGAGVGARIGRRVAVPRHGWLVPAVVLEVVLVTAAATLSIGLDVPAVDGRRFVVIALLAAAMGARNAAVRDLAIKDLTTTVLTMTLTGLAADLGGGGRLARRRVAAVASMLLGAVMGALCVIHVSLALPLYIAAALAALSLVAVRWRA